MIKNFLMRQMLKRQMKDVPVDKQEAIFSAIEKNPDFFMNIAKKVKEKTDQGMDQNTATMAIVKENEEELRKIMGK